MIISEMVGANPPEGTKRCAVCSQHLPYEAFNKQKRVKSGLQPACRECKKDWYRKNKEAHVKNVRHRERKIRAAHAERLFAYLSIRQCTDCNEDDPVVLEFDHVRGEKRNDVSEMLHQALKWETILAEIAKCEVVCSNCHKRRTHIRANTYRAKWIGRSKQR